MITIKTGKWPISAQSVQGLYIFKRFFFTSNWTRPHGTCMLSELPHGGSVILWMHHNSLSSVLDKWSGFQISNKHGSDIQTCLPDYDLWCVSFSVTHCRNNSYKLDPKMQLQWVPAEMHLTGDGKTWDKQISTTSQNATFKQKSFLKEKLHLSIIRDAYENFWSLTPEIITGSGVVILVACSASVERDHVSAVVCMCTNFSLHVTVVKNFSHFIANCWHTRSWGGGVCLIWPSVSCIHSFILWTYWILPQSHCSCLTIPE